MEWASEDFFQRGAILTDKRDGSLILAKGGEIREVSEIPSDSAGKFYLKDFFKPTYIEYSPAQSRRINPSEFILPDSSASFIEDSDEEDIYERDFKNLISSFDQDLQKVVLISRKNYLPSHFHKAKRQMIARASSFGEGISYGFWTEDFGIVGATPEILFETTGLELKTYALAGTAPKHLSEDLLSSQKDLHEHELVIKNITEVLNSFSELIDKGETRTFPFRNLVHLRTDISAKLKDKKLVSEILPRLSPTAALGGYPKDEALRFLMNSEYYSKYPQRIFGSAFGFFEENYSQFVVMIRNIQWKEEKFFIESGGGIVKESELSKEIEELRLKRKIIEEYFLET